MNKPDASAFWNIPVELQQLKQWIIWRYEETDGSKPTKVPYCAHGNMGHASVTDPATWGTFAEAVAAFERGQCAGIGFIFTDADPYAGIDLDALANNLAPDVRQQMLDRQLEVFKRFDSYSEYSPSGQGLHIIIRASLPSGRKRSGIELYSKARFFTFTGNVYHNAPIQDRQGLAEVLYNQMGKNVEQYYYDGEAAELHTDEQVMAMALGAANGDKFAKLITEEWKDLYPDSKGGDQSRADFAFIDIIAYYTQNRRQIQRIFQSSILGQRKKAKRKDYIDAMINKSFDRMLPPLDMDGLYNQVETYKAEMAAASPAAAMTSAAAQGAGIVSQPLPAPASASVGMQYPRGLMGEIAHFIYAASPRPCHEVAIAGAIGLMSGICGRAYNVSGTGVNMYTLLLAQTGVGKEAMSEGVSKLVNACSRMGDGSTMTTPSVSKFLGPSAIASAQGLQKELAEQPSFLSIVGEFGLRMSALCHPRASANDMNLKALLLELYGKSGRGNMLGKMSYSDKDKNVAAIASPAFSMLAESTPHTFLKIVDEDLVLNGLLPRFLIIEYSGGRVDLAESHHMAMPSFDLTEKLGKLAIQAHALSGQGTPVDVQYEPEAYAWARDFDRHCTAKMNASTSEVTRELWNRAHIKLLRLSALVAIGVNPITPVVSSVDIAWAYKIIEKDITSMTRRFEAGEVGNIEEADNLKQLKDMYKVLLDYVNRPFDELKGYDVKSDAYQLKLISHSYISRRLTSVASFRKDRLGARNAIKACITDLLEQGVIVKAPATQVANVLKTSGSHYMLQNLTYFK